MPLEARGGDAREIGYLFRLHRQICGRQVEAICRLMSLAAAWELRLDIGGSVQRAHVCGSRDEALDTSDGWKAAMIERGWC
jgi:hypothetical protein